MYSQFVIRVVSDYPFSVRLMTKVVVECGPCGSCKTTMDIGLTPLQGEYRSQNETLGPSALLD